MASMARGSGERVAGDTMLPCGRCARCAAGRGHLCEDRAEVGIRKGCQAHSRSDWSCRSPRSTSCRTHWMTRRALLPNRAPTRSAPSWRRSFDPGSGSSSSVRGRSGSWRVCSPRADGAEVHVMARSARSVGFARGLGFAGVWTRDELPRLPFDAVLEASNDPDLPALAAELVEPGGRVVYIGLSGDPSLVDTRSLALKEVTAAGVLSGYGGIPAAIARLRVGRRRRSSARRRDRRARRGRRRARRPAAARRGRRPQDPRGPDPVASSPTEELVDRARSRPSTRRGPDEASTRRAGRSRTVVGWLSPQLAIAASTDAASSGASIPTSTTLPPASPSMVERPPMTDTCSNRVASVAASARTNASGG